MGATYRLRNKWNPFKPVGITCVRYCCCFGQFLLLVLFDVVHAMQVELAYLTVTGHHLSRDQLLSRFNDDKVSFDDFCCIVSEFRYTHHVSSNKLYNFVCISLYRL